MKTIGELLADCTAALAAQGKQASDEDIYHTPKHAGEGADEDFAKALTNGDGTRLPGATLHDKAGGSLAVSVRRHAQCG